MLSYRKSLKGVLAFGFLTVLIYFFYSPQKAYANILGNFSFEESIGSGVNQNWDNTNGAERVSSVAGFSNPPNGSFYLALNTDGEFTFQTNDNIQPGNFVSFSALVESSIADDLTPGNDTDNTDGGQLRIEFKGINSATGSDFLISDVTSVMQHVGNAQNNFGFRRVTISGRAPAGTQRVVFTIRRQGTAGAGNVVFDNVNGEVNPAKLTLTASKTTVKAGDVVTVVADFVNNSQTTFNNTELKIEPPAGFDILTDTIRKDGQPTSIRDGSVLIAAQTLSPTDKFRVVFQMLVTSGVRVGASYGLTALITSNGQISEVRSLNFRIKGDPVFDEGTVLGKVFDDRNEDGVQDPGESGVPRVRIFTEYGVSVVTDRHGRFHLPAVRPGRHLLKIDGHTLPEGTAFVTEESLLIKTTPGLLNKVRFAVHLPDDALPEEYRKELHVWVTQGIDATRPKLRVSLEPRFLILGLGRFRQEASFQIDTNYEEFLAGWRIEVRDELGEVVWTGVGINAPPPFVRWDGMTDRGEMIEPGVYSYRLVVRDSKDHEDWTPLGFLKVMSRAESLQNEKEETLETPGAGHMNLFRDGKRTIPLVAKPTVRIYGTTPPDRKVSIDGRPIFVSPNGEFEKEYYVQPGEKDILVTAANEKGEALTVEKKINVKDSYFFLVALGEEEMGFSHLKGNAESVARDDTYKEGFYQDGRFSYYLKAKIKGKFLVKSRYDTGNDKEGLFTRLDPDEYYPIYGDTSQIEYEGQETQERLFLLVEMDRSFLQWGSYETAFTDTELGRFNRTLSGLKAHYETLGTTKYGDAKKGFTLFWSDAKSLSDHNEFLATGGSLYYLRNRNVVQGSEKIRVETRDKIQDVPLENRDLVYGKDYEIDYAQGRILLKSPLSSVSASETIITNDILDGNPVFLIVDYEFESIREHFNDQPHGIRAFTHLGEQLRFGVTGVEEKRQNQDYDLRAVDATYRTGRNTKITAEFAQAKLQQVRQAASFDGGLTFNHQSPLRGRRPREKAYVIKGESKPLEPLEISGYLQNVEPGFSVDRIKSQEGFKKYGLQARLKIAEPLRLVARHDSSEVVSQLRPLTEKGISAEFDKIRSSTVQAIFDQGPWNVVGEYLHQTLDIPLNNRVDSFFSQLPFGNALGLRVKRQVSPTLAPYFKTQYAVSGKNNFQIGGGVDVHVNNQTKITFEEMIGRPGDSTMLSVSRQVDPKTTSYAQLRSQEDGVGERRVSTTFGSSHQLTDKSRLYTEREYSTYTGNLPLQLIPGTGEGASGTRIWSSDIYGYETSFLKDWDLGLRFERRHLNADDFRALSDEAQSDLVRTNTFNTLALNLGYNDPEKWTWSDSIELRVDQDAPEVLQWLSQNSVEWRVHQDLSFLGRANFGTSRLLEPGQLSGQFYEITTGFAYRPVEHDRWSGLVRYTYLKELASDAQFGGTDDSGLLGVDERSHLFSVEGGYELTSRLQVVEKVALRLGRFKTDVTDWVGVHSYLWAHRFNYHVTRKWDLGLEYRALFQGDSADTLRHGPLVEVDREFYDYLRFGVGYNFTDFDDDLRTANDLTRHGLFVRLTGKV